ncbi:UNVERIFIED_CONTAM: hypothetical protein RF648_19590 [Kocuria sp. CPCC 205274]
MAKNVIKTRGKNPFPPEIQKLKKQINSYKTTLRRKVQTYKNGQLGKLQEIEVLENRLKNKYYSTAGKTHGELLTMYNEMKQRNKDIGSIKQGLRRLDSAIGEFFSEVDAVSMSTASKVQLQIKYYEVIRKINELIKDGIIHSSYTSEEIQETINIEKKWKDLSQNVDWNSDVEDIAIAVGMQIGEVEASNAVENFLDAFS